MLTPLDGWDGQIKMSLRAKCLPQKPSLHLSATKTTTFKTPMKQMNSRFYFKREKSLSIIATRSIIARTRSTKHLATQRNVRAALKCSTKSTTSRNNQKTLSSRQPVDRADQKISKVKACNKLELDKSSSSVSCSRSGRRLVPARCACANDSVTTRCSIHNNTRQKTSSTLSEFKLPQNCAKVVPKGSQAETR